MDEDEYSNSSYIEDVGPGDDLVADGEVEGPVILRRSVLANGPGAPAPSTSLSNFRFEEWEDSPTIGNANEKALAFLLGHNGLTIEAAATEIGVSAKTISRRLQSSPSLQRDVSDMRRLRVAAITGRLVASSDGAITVLNNELGAAHSRDRRAAARDLLKVAAAYHRDQLHDDEIAARLDRLEARQNPNIGAGDIKMGER